MPISKILLIAAAICFAIAVVGLDVRINLVPLGLLFWVLSLIL